MVSRSRNRAPGSTISSDEGRLDAAGQRHRAGRALGEVTLERHALDRRVPGVPAADVAPERPDVGRGRGRRARCARARRSWRQSSRVSLRGRPSSRGRRTARGRRRQRRRPAGGQATGDALPDQERAVGRARSITTRAPSAATWNWACVFDSDMSADGSSTRWRTCSPSRRSGRRPTSARPSTTKDSPVSKLTRHRRRGAGGVRTTGRRRRAWLGTAGSRAAGGRWLRPARPPGPPAERLPRRSATAACRGFAGTTGIGGAGGGRGGGGVAGAGAGGAAAAVAGGAAGSGPGRGARRGRFRGRDQPEGGEVDDVARADVRLGQLLGHRPHVDDHGVR